MWKRVYGGGVARERTGVPETTERMKERTMGREFDVSRVKLRDVLLRHLCGRVFLRVSAATPAPAVGSL